MLQILTFDFVIGRAQVIPGLPRLQAASSGPTGSGVGGIEVKGFCLSYQTGQERLSHGGWVIVTDEV